MKFYFRSESSKKNSVKLFLSTMLSLDALKRKGKKISVEEGFLNGERKKPGLKLG